MPSVRRHKERAPNACQSLDFLGFVRAKVHVRAGDIKLIHCETEEMMADLLTKYVAAPRFVYLRGKVLSVE